MRSDHLRAHINKVHKAALLESPPPNWFKHGEHIIVRRQEIKDAMGTKIAADRFPQGVCLNCASVLRNTDKGLDTFTSHICKEKQQRVRGTKTPSQDSGSTTSTPAADSAAPSWEEFWVEARKTLMSIRQPKGMDAERFGENKVKLQGMFQTALDYSNDGDEETPNINYREALLMVMRDLATEFVAPVTATAPPASVIQHVPVTKVGGFEVAVRRA